MVFSFAMPGKTHGPPKRAIPGTCVFQSGEQMNEGGWPGFARGKVAAPLTADTPQDRVAEGVGNIIRFAAHQ